MKPVVSSAARGVYESKIAGGRHVCQGESCSRVGHNTSRPNHWIACPEKTCIPGDSVSRPARTGDSEAGAGHL